MLAIIRYSPGICLLPLMLTFLWDSSAEPTPRVAIVGTGITGAATAYYYNNASSAEIVVFERRKNPGGRLFQKTFFGESFNAGANYILKQNEMISELMDIAGLNRSWINSVKNGKSAVWDGEKMRFVEGNFFQNLWRAWKRGYPIFRNVFKNNALDSLKDWQKVGRSVRRGDFFETPHEVVRALNLQELIGKTTVEWLMEISGLGREETLALPFVDDILGGGQLNNYNQHLQSTGALVSLVSAISLSVDTSDIFIPRESSKFTENLLSQTNAEIRLKTKVSKIEKDDDSSGYYVHYEEIGLNGWLHQGKEKFDLVFIATPLWFAGGLHVDIAWDLVKKEKEVKFQMVWTMFVSGRLSGEYFGLTQEEIDEIGDIIVPNSVKNSFNSIGRVWRTCGGSSECNSTVALYKIFSSGDIPILELERLFLPGFEIEDRWETPGYPLYKKGKTSQTNTPFQLAEGLFYPSSLETCFSAAEVAALGARIAVNLALNGGDRSFYGLAEDAAEDKKEEL